MRDAKETAALRVLGSHASIKLSDLPKSVNESLLRRLDAAGLVMARSHTCRPATKDHAGRRVKIGPLSPLWHSPNRDKGLIESWKDLWRQSHENPEEAAEVKLSDHGRAEYDRLLENESVAAAARAAASKPVTGIRRPHRPERPQPVADLIEPLLEVLLGGEQLSESARTLAEKFPGGAPTIRISEEYELFEAAEQDRMEVKGKPWNEDAERLTREMHEQMVRPLREWREENRHAREVFENWWAAGERVLERIEGAIPYLEGAVEGGARTWASGLQETINALHWIGGPAGKNPALWSGERAAPLLERIDKARSTLQTAVLADPGKADPLRGPDGQIYSWAREVDVPERSKEVQVLIDLLSQVVGSTGGLACGPQRFRRQPPFEDIPADFAVYEAGKRGWHELKGVPWDDAAQERARSYHQQAMRRNKEWKELLVAHANNFDLWWDTIKAAAAASPKVQKHLVGTEAERAAWVGDLRGELLQLQGLGQGCREEPWKWPVEAGLELKEKISRRCRSLLTIVVASPRTKRRAAPTKARRPSRAPEAPPRTYAITAIDPKNHTFTVRGATVALQPDQFGAVAYILSGRGQYMSPSKAPQKYKRADRLIKRVPRPLYRLIGRKDGAGGGYRIDPKYLAPGVIVT